MVDNLLEEGKMDWCKGKIASKWSYCDSSFAARDWLFSGRCMLVGRKGPQWWEWHDGSWVADHTLWLSGRRAQLVWLPTQIECSHRRWTVKQTQGHWWLTYAWWLELLHQNYRYIQLGRFIWNRHSVWKYFSANSIHFYRHLGHFIEIYIAIWNGCNAKKKKSIISHLIKLHD